MQPRHAAGRRSRGTDSIRRLLARAVGYRHCEALSGHRSSVSLSESGQAKLWGANANNGIEQHNDILDCPIRWPLRPRFRHTMHCRPFRKHCKAHIFDMSAILARHGASGAQVAGPRLHRDIFSRTCGRDLRRGTNATTLRHLPSSPSTRPPTVPRTERGMRGGAGGPPFPPASPSLSPLQFRPPAPPHLHPRPSRPPSSPRAPPPRSPPPPRHDRNNEEEEQEEPLSWRTGAEGNSSQLAHAPGPSSHNSVSPDVRQAGLHCSKLIHSLVIRLKWGQHAF